ncbi:MAG: hypothetical protein LBC67_03770 [Spirochaetales bacterium]|nr:hypothetical protein [Spirochaetales bacterium]
MKIHKLFSLILVLGGCAYFDNETPEISVKNSSSYPVTFELENSIDGEQTLTPGTSGVYTAGSAKLVYYKSVPGLRVTPVSQTKNFVEFTDTPAITLRVMNHFAEAVNLSAAGYIDSEPLSVAANTLASGTIYTNRPQFTVETTSGFPASCEFVYDKDQNTVFVTVR